jgi:hypothetical protein
MWTPWPSKRKGSHSRVRRPTKRYAELCFEQLESRLAPAVFVVNSTGDAEDAFPGDGVSSTVSTVSGDPLFIGESPPVAGSGGELSLRQGIAINQVFRWRSSDPILGDIDTGLVKATKWVVVGANPTRLVFEGSGGGVTVFGDVLFEPYSRSVVDVVKDSQRIRYLIRGESTLRAAMMEANALPGEDRIVFNIPRIDPRFDPGRGTFLIQPNSSLPAVVDALTIDGTSQPGTAGAPIIELDGGLTGPATNGLTVEAVTTTIQGLSVKTFGTATGVRRR